MTRRTHHKTQPHLRGLRLLLGMAMFQWQSLHAALHIAKRGSPGWKIFSNDPALAQVLASEARRKLVNLLRGIDSYLGMPYAPEHPFRPAIWHSGGARLLDCGAPEDLKSRKPVILLVPSLINRYYILDLSPGSGFAGYLHARGLHPFILDWGEPGQAERDFRCGDYIARYLREALRTLHSATGRPVILAGYCMGGLFALAAAQLYTEYVEKLALFATPWDFHAPDVARIPLAQQDIAQFERYVTRHNGLGADEIQMLFHLADAQPFFDKFEQFALMNPESQEAQRFVAVERWVNDGVPLVPRVAVECYTGWLQRNLPCSGKWKVAGKTVDPGKITQPAFIAAPRHDRIVPGGCSLPLARLIPRAALIEPESGHIGMMAGGGRKEQCWDPFLEWLRTVGT